MASQTWHNAVTTRQCTIQQTLVTSNTHAPEYLVMNEGDHIAQQACGGWKEHYSPAGIQQWLEPLPTATTQGHPKRGKSGSLINSC